MRLSHMTFTMSRYVLFLFFRVCRLFGKNNELQHEYLQTFENNCIIVSSHALSPMYDKLFMHVCAQLLQSCPTLCNPIDCRPPSSFVHGILQARILDWVAISQRSLQNTSNTTRGTSGDFICTATLEKSLAASPSFFILSPDFGATGQEPGAWILRSCQWSFHDSW